MSPNPYQPPAYEPVASGQSPSYRPLFILAGIGALMASAYWAALTFLITFAAAAGKLSPAQILLPCLLIAFYAIRGFQLFKCDPRAAKRILWLHGIGAIVALMQLFSGSLFVIVLQSVKIAIHIFGGTAAALALRAYTRAT